MTRIRDLSRAHTDPGVMADHGRAGAEILLDGLAVVVPAVVFIEFQIIGRLFLSEIILLGMLPILLIAKGRHLLERLPLIFILLGLAWLGSQVLTDLVRSTPFQDFSRGWAKIGMTLVNFSAIYMFLYGSRVRVVLFTFGLGLGYLLQNFFNPTDLMLSDPWKFGVGYGVAHMVIVLVQMRPIRDIWLMPGAILAATGLLSLILGTRSLAGMCIIGGVYITLYQTLRARSSVGTRSNARAFVVAVIVIVASLAASQAYVNAAGEGMLGVDAQEKYWRQSETGLGFLLGGRTEFVVSSMAIMESPLIGHGSWAKDPYYASLILRYRPELTTVYEAGLIPTHSYMLGAWVEAGVVGAVFWAWIWILNARALGRVFTIREPLVFMFGLMGVIMAWDVLFSPYGASQRIIAPFYIVVSMFLLQMVEYWRKVGAAAAHAPPADRTTGARGGP